MPYIQFESVDDFIPEPRCSKFVVGLQPSGNKMGCQRSDQTQDRRVKSDGSSYVHRVLERMLCVALENV